MKQQTNKEKDDFFSEMQDDKFDLFGSRNNYRYEDSIDVSQNKLRDKATEIQKMISEYEYRLRGYVWESNGQNMYYQGNVLAGEMVIQKIILLLHSFSKEIILISNKSKETWAKQLYRTSYQLISILTRDIESTAESYKVIFYSFYNVMQNIGDIIGGNNSKDFLSKMFGFEQSPLIQDNIKPRGDIPL
jgi:hypothetical protein